MDRRFRFGIVAAQASDGAQWAETARRIEGLGYDTLLVPDNLGGLAPFAALTAGATATTTLRVGSYVLAAPYRSPADVAWGSATLDLLSGHRFELGVGAGRPAAAGEAAQLERGFGTFAERVEQVASTIEAARQGTPGLRVLAAGSGRTFLERVASLVDTVALGLPPEADETALAAKVSVLREAAATRADDIELNVNLLAIGNETPPWMRQHLGLDVADLAARGSAAVLTGSIEQMVDTLKRRRDTLGISYIVTNAAFMDALAPVVARLTAT
jgi:probable F420-dependent oxidoreductase